MDITFFVAAVIAVATTARVITCVHPVHALLYLIVSLLAVAVAFYALGAPFAAALEVIVYAGAVMVLFVFVVMMLNLNAETATRERHWLRPRLWIGPGILALILLAAVITALTAGPAIGSISGATMASSAVGKQLFGPYALAVELSAFVLLAALVVTGHIGRDDRDVKAEAAERGERHPSNAGE